MAVMSVTASCSERKLQNALATSMPQYVAMPWLRHEKIKPIRRHHKNLGQRQRHALARAFGRCHELRPDHVVAGLRNVVIAGQVVDLVVAACIEPVNASVAARCRDLLV